MNAISRMMILGLCFGPFGHTAHGTDEKFFFRVTQIDQQDDAGTGLAMSVFFRGTHYPPDMWQRLLAHVTKMSPKDAATRLNGGGISEGLQAGVSVLYFHVADFPLPENWQTLRTFNDLKLSEATWYTKKRVPLKKIPPPFPCGEDSDEVKLESDDTLRSVPSLSPRSNESAPELLD